MQIKSIHMHVHKYNNFNVSYYFPKHPVLVYPRFAIDVLKVFHTLYIWQYASLKGLCDVSAFNCVPKF